MSFPQREIEGDQALDIRYLVLWLTNDCNLRCSYCYANAGEKKEYMTFDTARRAIDLAANNPFKLQLAGGEPLMNFELICQIHDYLKSSRVNASLQLQTNGALITRDIVARLKNMKIAIGISLDGPPSVNESLRGGTGATIRGIQLLAEEGIMVNLNAVVTAQNIHTIPQLADMALFFGNVGGIGLDLLRKAGRAGIRQDVASKAAPDMIARYLRRAYQRTVELESLFNRKVIIREVEDARKRLARPNLCRSYCHAVDGRAMVVLPDGAAYPCGSLAGVKDYQMGSIHDVTGLRTVKLGVKKPARCSACKFERFCQGACPSRVIVNGGEDRFSPQDCALRKTSFELVMGG